MLLASLNQEGPTKAVFGNRRVAPTLAGDDLKDSSHPDTEFGCISKDFPGWHSNGAMFPVTRIFDNINQKLGSHLQQTLRASERMDVADRKSKRLNYRH